MKKVLTEMILLSTISVLHIAKDFLRFHERPFASPVLWYPQCQQAAIGTVPTSEDTEEGGLRDLLPRERTDSMAAQRQGSASQFLKGTKRTDHPD